MKAVTVRPGDKDSAELSDRPTPEPKAGEVRVRVIEVGIDGTDIDIYSGAYGEAPPGEERLIIGHEAVGQVDKIGPHVSGHFEGELVVPTVRRGCAESCPSCRQLMPDMCRTGNYQERGISKLHGYMAEYFVDAPDNVIRLPSHLRDIGVLVEPTSICQKAVDAAFKIQERIPWQPQTALVLGAGNIGLLSTFLLRSMGLETYTLDIVPRDTIKASLATRVGANYIDRRDASLIDLPDVIGSPDLVIESTGYSRNAFEAMQIVGRNGIVSLISVTAGQNEEELCTNCIEEKLVTGNRLAFGSVSSNQYHFERSIQHMVDVDRKWPGIYAEMLTRRIPMTDFKEGFSKTPADIKTVIVVAA